MITLTIKTTVEPTEIVLIISPTDAFEILERFKNKYPNAEKSNISLQMFIDKWTTKEITKS